MTKAKIKTKYRTKLKEYIENPILDEFFKSRKNVSDKYSSTFTSSILNYLRWRKISLEELLKSGKNEEEFLGQFVEKSLQPENIRSRRNIASSIRRLLRFHKIEIVTPETKRTETWYYVDDPKMKDFLEIHLHSSKQTKKMINRALADFCDFRKKTPSELIEEEPTVKQIKQHLRKFFSWKKERFQSVEGKKEVSDRFVWHKVLLIKRFYEEYLDVLFKFKEYEKPIIGEDSKPQETLTKEQMKKILLVADVRDSMILYAYGSLDYRR